MFTQSFSNLKQIDKLFVLSVLALNHFVGGIEPCKQNIKPVIVCHKKHKIYPQNYLFL
jgi:hypothetical protein